jgi:hypothetical protein
MPGLSLFLSGCLPSLSFYGQNMAGRFKNRPALNFFNLKALQTISVGCVYSSLTEPRTKAKKCSISLHHFLFTDGYGFRILKAREANLRLPDLSRLLKQRRDGGEGFGCIPETGWREEGEITVGLPTSRNRGDNGRVTNFQKQGR